MKRNKGISLIILIITIIIIIILSGVIILSLSKNNPILQASKAVFLSDVKNFEDELELYKMNQFVNGSNASNNALLEADDKSITYNGVIDTNKTINDLIPLLGKNTNYTKEFEVIDGKLVYKGSDTNRKNWAKEISLETKEIWDGTAATKYQGGDGTEANPYLIENTEQLAYLATCVNAGEVYGGKYFRLVNNLYFDSNHQWISIGSTVTNKCFKGNFDGDGHVISGLNGNYGLFGYTYNSVIKNLGVENSIFVSTDSYAAGLIAIACYSTIDGCYFGGRVESTNNHAAGITCGYGNTISNCYNKGTIIHHGSYTTENGHAGGICTYPWDSVGTIMNCYNIGSVTSTNTNNPYVGAIVGRNKSTISNCFYLEGSSAKGIGEKYQGTVNVVEPRTAEIMKSDDFIVNTINGFVKDTKNINNSYPILPWQRLTGTYKSYTNSFNNWNFATTSGGMSSSSYGIYINGAASYENTNTVLCTKEKIDLTGINRISVTIHMYNDGGGAVNTTSFGLSNSNESDTNFVNSYVVTNTSGSNIYKTFTINVSGLNGEYYLKMLVHHSSSPYANTVFSQMRNIIFE